MEAVDKERRVVSETKRAFGVSPENARSGSYPDLEPRGVEDKIKGDFEDAARVEDVMGALESRYFHDSRQLALRS